MALGAEAEARGADLEALKSGLRERDVSEFYRAYAAAGVEFGPSFRTVRALWSGSGEAVGEVSLDGGSGPGDAGVDPVLLDGCFHVVVAALEAGGAEPRTGPDEAGTAYAAVGWDRLWLRGALPERVTCHARLRVAAGEPGRGTPNGASAEVMTADMWLYAEDGAAVGGAAGIAFRRATRSAFQAAVGRAEDLLYAPVWRDVGLRSGPRPANFLLPPDEAASAAGGIEEHLAPAGLSGDLVSALYADLERLSRAYAVAALDELGWRRQPGAEVEAESCAGG